MNVKSQVAEVIVVGTVLLIGNQESFRGSAAVRC